MALSYYHLNEFLKKNPQYGATPEQALKAAATGAVTGAIFAGVSGMAQAGNWGRAATMSANSLTGGAMAKVQGGDFVTGMGYMLATQAAAWGYESMMEYGANPNPGTNDPNNTTYNEDINGGRASRTTNTFGINKPIDPLNPHWYDFLKQQSSFSQFMNEIPSMNAISKLHDFWVTQAGNVSTGGMYGMFVPSMPVAGAATYLALMPPPVTVQLAVQRQ